MIAELTAYDEYNGKCDESETVTALERKEKGEWKSLERKEKSVKHTQKKHKNRCKWAPIFAPRSELNFR